MFPDIRYYAGKGTPSPMPGLLVASIQSVEITHSNEGASGCQITFGVGRSRLTDTSDDKIVSHSALKVFNRVVVQVIFGANSLVLFDGLITRHEFAPSNMPTGGRFTITAEDASVMMDMEEKTVEHPNQHEGTIATKIIGEYSQYGLVPKVKNPPTIIVPTVQERVPVQHETDLQYLRRMAARYNYDFYIVPGKTPFVNDAYWGPPVRRGTPQRALTLDMGRHTNLGWVNFQYNALAPTDVEDRFQARTTDKQGPSKQKNTTLDALSARPGLSSQRPNVRKSFLRAPWGLDQAQAKAQAQAMVDDSVEQVLTATGELLVGAYGDVLSARELVDLRGVGATHNGTYFVKSVTHTITSDNFTQRFTLTREGTGEKKPIVRV